MEQQMCIDRSRAIVAATGTKLLWAFRLHLSISLSCKKRPLVKATVRCWRVQHHGN
jgi:hypothetical protein